MTQGGQGLKPIRSIEAAAGTAEIWAFAGAGTGRTVG